MVIIIIIIIVVYGDNSFKDLGRCFDKIRDRVTRKHLIQQNRYYKNSLERSVNKMNDPNKKDSTMI